MRPHSPCSRTSTEVLLQMFTALERRQTRSCPPPPSLRPAVAEVPCGIGLVFSRSVPHSYPVSSPPLTEKGTNKKKKKRKRELTDALDRALVFRGGQAGELARSRFASGNNSKNCDSRYFWGRDKSAGVKSAVLAGYGDITINARSSRSLFDVIDDALAQKMKLAKRVTFFGSIRKDVRKDERLFFNHWHVPRSTMDLTFRSDSRVTPGRRIVAYVFLLNCVHIIELEFRARRSCKPIYVHDCRIRLFDSTFSSIKYGQDYFFSINKRLFVGIYINVIIILRKL